MKSSDLIDTETNEQQDRVVGDSTAGARLARVIAETHPSYLYNS